MPNIAIYVNGQIISVPGVYVNTTVTPVTPSGLLPTGPLVFIASGYGGVPFAPVNYTDATSLTQAMRGAPSSDLIPFMFNPSSELNGTSLVTYINVAPNTQSSATIVSSGSIGVIDLLSANYGAPSNAVEYSIGAASVAGVSMTLLDGFSGATFTGDNLGVPFQLAYTGTSSSVTYSVTSSIAGKATSFVINSPNSGESVTLDLTTQTFSTISQVVQYLNGTGFYTCLVISNGNLPSYYLDVASSIALPKPVSSVDQYVNVTATLGAVVSWVNTFASSIATAKIHTGITSNPGYVPVLTALQFFSGATNGVPSLANYASGFNVALNVPAWAVIADSNSAGVRSLGAQHAATASSIVNKTWRRFVTGSVLGETPTTAQANAQQTNEFMVTYCWPGIQATNPTTGLNQTYDGLHTAAAVAGMMTGNAIPIPLTNKTLLGNGVETLANLPTKTLLQDAGVLVLDYPINTKIPTLLTDVTTWQNDDTPTNVFNQQVSCRFGLSYALVTALTPYIGTIASNFDIARAQNAVKALLNSMIYNGNNLGILNSWDPTTLVLTYDGSTQTLNVSVAVVFVGQNIFIVVNVQVQPLNISISSQGVITNG